MTDWDDLEGMEPSSVAASCELVDALLAGDPLDGQTRSIDEFARLVRASRGPVTEADLTGRATAVAALAAGEIPNVVAIQRGSTRVRRMVVAKAAVAAAVLCSAGVAAALTGVMQGDDGGADPVIMTPSSAGKAETSSSITSPTTTSDDAATTTTIIPATTTTPGSATRGAGAVGPSATGPARNGLCNAFGARTEMPGKSVAARNLLEAAGAAGQSVAEFCAVAPATTTTAPSAKPGGGENGKADGQGPAPAGGTPNPAPGGSENGKANANPNSKAADASNGKGAGRP